jgi:hypothetical protein
LLQGKPFPSSLSHYLKGRKFSESHIMVDAPGLYLQYWQYHDFSLCAFRTLELQIYPTNMLPDMEFVT